MTNLPSTFQGTVKYPFNVRSIIGLQPKGFVVFIDFDSGLAPTGVQEFRVVAQIQAYALGIAHNYLCIGTVNFIQNTLTFESDRPPARFTGKIDAAIPQIKGTITFDILTKPHEIVFLPFAR